MRPLIHFILVHLSFAATASSAADGSARIFDAGNSEVVLYTYRLHQEVKGEQVLWSTRFLNTESVEIATETATTQSGRLVRYHLKQLLQDEEAEIVAGAREIEFRYRRGGKWQRTKERFTADTIAPPQIVERAQTQWTKIQAGETVLVRLAVPDRLETFGFRYRKKPSKAPGKTLVEFSPSSFLIRQFAPSVELIFDDKTRKLLSLRGPSFLKKREGDAWVPLNAEFRFD